MTAPPVVPSVALPTKMASPLTSVNWGNRAKDGHRSKPLGCNGNLSLRSIRQREIAFSLLFVEVLRHSAALASPTRRLEGNRGAIGPGGIRALKPDEPNITPFGFPKRPWEIRGIPGM